MTLYAKLQKVAKLEVNHPEVLEFLNIVELKFRLATGNPELDIINPTLLSKHSNFRWGSEGFLDVINKYMTASVLLNWLFYWPEVPETKWTKVCFAVRGIYLDKVSFSSVSEIKKRIKL